MLRTLFCADFGRRARRKGAGAGRRLCLTLSSPGSLRFRTRSEGYFEPPVRLDEPFYESRTIGQKSSTWIPRDGVAAPTPRCRWPTP